VEKLYTDSRRSSGPKIDSFFKYNVIDMGRPLEVEVGWPIEELLDGDERVLVRELPAGRYAWESELAFRLA
jgi:hypothetical protein